MVEVLAEEQACPCTGIRWCALCNDPCKREKWGLHPIRTHASEGIKRRVVCYDDARVINTGKVIPGLSIYENVLSEAEEEQLLAEISAYAYTKSVSGRYKQSFGPSVNFNKRKLKLGSFKGMPAYTSWLFPKIFDTISLEDSELCKDMVITSTFVQKYVPDLCSHFDFHTDDTFAYGDRILGVSLASDSYLTLQKPEEPDGGNKSTTLVDKCQVKIKLPRRSVFVLSGDARYAWQHAILPEDVVAERVSITLRETSDELRDTDAGRELEKIATGNGLSAEDFNAAQAVSAARAA